MSYWGNKYKNKRTQIDGYWFQSQLEAALYQYLKLLVSQGELSDLQCQATVNLTEANVKYVADFAATRRGENVWFEAKGVETASWRIKRRLWQVYGPGRLEIWKGSAKRIYKHETLDPRPRPRFEYQLCDQCRGLK